MLLAACGDRPSPAVPAPPVDSVSPPVTPVDSARPLTPSSWDAALGELLVMPRMGADAAATASVSVLSPLLPLEADPSDTTGVRQRIGETAVTLVARRGALGDAWLDAAAVAPAAFPSGCPGWPTARFRAPVESAGAGWLIGLPAGRASAVPLDSIEALATRDSAMLAAGLTRLASGVPEDSGSVFRGLPVTVVRAYRSTRGTPAIVVADLVRRIPQEDQPLVEHLVLVVEQAGPTVASWRVGWFERMSGREEEVITLSPLALLQVGPAARLSLLLGRDADGTPEVVLLERDAGGWSVRWSSVPPSC